jgi:threonine synthase
MTLAMSKAMERGARAVICASTGNTSASAAAYAARAGLRAFVLIPEGKIALGKLAQAMFHGGRVLQIRGNFDDALKIVREISETHPVVLVNSLNPDRIEGQKTGAFEICDQLGEAPTYQFMPVGNAGNITAYWRGYREYRQAGKCGRLPRMIGWQAEGAAPIVRARGGAAGDHRLGHPDRQPGSWKGAVEAVQQSQGAVDMVSDEEILRRTPAGPGGRGVRELASAASVADRQVGQGHGVSSQRLVVCVLTGHG